VRWIDEGHWTRVSLCVPLHSSTTAGTIDRTIERSNDRTSDRTIERASDWMTATAEERPWSPKPHRCNARL